MFDSSTASRHNVAAACIAGALLLAGGCATDNGGDPFEGINNPLAGGIPNPFQGPSESGFFALIRKNCSSYTIGSESLATLREADTGIGALTAKLYRGDLSNDEYIDLLLQQYPAANANVPATGCVINQLDTCLSTDCRLTPKRSAELKRAEEMVAEDQQRAVDQVAEVDRAQVETMIDQADEAAEDAAVDLSTEP